MKHAVFAGGFGNGVANAERAAEALEGVLDTTVEAFTFSKAMKDPEVFKRAVRGAKLITHSASMLAAVEADPQEVHAFNAPLPREIPTILWNTLKKTVYMHTPTRGIRKAEDTLAIARYDLSATAELAVNPIANLKHLRAISKFDAISTAYSARNHEIPTFLTYTEDDLYYQLTESDFQTARSLQVPITMLPGQHDEVVLHPERVFEAYFNSPTIR